jgi:RimJ/RimL family protein N-acetyltransferase
LALAWGNHNLSFTISGSSNSYVLTSFMNRDLPLVPKPTERLEFRNWDQEDAGTVLGIYSKREVYEFLGTSPSSVNNLDEAKLKVDKWEARRKGIQGIWAVVPKAGDFKGRPVGSVLLVDLINSEGVEAKELEIGWHLDPQVSGNGYATEAVQPVIARAKESGVQELRAVVYLQNLRSATVCERLGMTYLGLTDRWYQITVKEFLLAL